MLPQATPPALLFAIPLFALALLSLQISAFFTSVSTSRRKSDATRRLIATSFIVAFTLLSVIAGGLGLAAFLNASSTVDAAHLNGFKKAERVFLAFIHFALGLVVVYLLFQRVLVEPLMLSSRFFSRNFRPVIVFLSSTLALKTTLSIIFAAMDAPYPATCVPTIFAFVFLGTALYLVDRLYLCTRDVNESGRHSFLWLTLGIAQVAGLLCAIFSLIERDSMRIPESFFRVVSVIGTMLACHVLFILPPALLLPPTPTTPHMLGMPTQFTEPNSPSPRHAHSRPWSANSRAASEDFLNLNDPFASPRPLTVEIFDGASAYAMSPRASTIMEKAPSPPPAARTKRGRNGAARRTRSRSFLAARKASASTLSHAPLAMTATAFGSSPSLVESGHDHDHEPDEGELMEVEKRGAGLGLGLGIGMSRSGGDGDLEERPATAKTREAALMSQKLLTVLESGIRPASAGGIPPMRRGHPSREVKEESTVRLVVLGPRPDTSRTV